MYTYSEATKITLPMQNSEHKPALSRRKHDEAASTHTHTCTTAAIIHHVSQLHVKNATKIGTSFKRREACDPGNTWSAEHWQTSAEWKQERQTFLHLSYVVNQSAKILSLSLRPVARTNLHDQHTDGPNQTPHLQLVSIHLLLGFKHHQLYGFHHMSGLQPLSLWPPLRPPARSSPYLWCSVPPSHNNRVLPSCSWIQRSLTGGLALCTCSNKSPPSDTLRLSFPLRHLPNCWSG